MKALELLNIIYKDCKEWEDKGFAVTYPTSDLSEAIKELEDLQNRSCKNCKYALEYLFDTDIECIKLEADTQGIFFEKDFYCKNWESK